MKRAVIAALCAIAVLSAAVVVIALTHHYTVVRTHKAHPARPAAPAKHRAHAPAATPAAPTTVLVEPQSRRPRTASPPAPHRPAGHPTPPPPSTKPSPRPTPTPTCNLPLPPALCP